MIDVAGDGGMLLSAKDNDSKSAEKEYNGLRIEEEEAEDDEGRSIVAEGPI
jgi:hypothetical protein